MNAHSIHSTASSRAKKVKTKKKQDDDILGENANNKYQ